MSVAVEAEKTQAVLATRKQMFNDFCNMLENQSIPYVILSGYQGYPDVIDSDVDFMVSDADFIRLPSLFLNSKNIPGAQLIQVLQHETSACYYVLANQVGDRIAYLHPDAAANYRRKGRLWLRSEFVLSSRRQAPAGFWVPSAAIEFEYYFVKRIDKRLVELRHLQRLSALLVEDPAGCRAVLTKLVPAEKLEVIAKAITDLDLAWFASQRDALQTMLANSLTRESIFDRVTSAISELMRRVHRVIKPTGLVVAVLGPDGSGKTTVIEHLEHELAPAFRKVKRFHLRPHFGQQGAGGIVTNPHASPPRGWLASLAKMVLFTLDYWSGYLSIIYPAKTCSTLVIFDRHFYDMVVDPKRYRLPINFWLTRFFVKLVPKPDLWLVLDAPAALLVSRKGEIDLASAEALSAGYRTLANTLPHGYLVDTSTSLDATLGSAVQKITEFMHSRTLAYLDENPERLSK
ncbi:MAG: hypothetical protein U1C48_05165 [Methylotenera sp.]|nr:hypothetical protein [Methylotenera sp.]